MSIRTRFAAALVGAALVAAPLAAAAPASAATAPVNVLRSYCYSYDIADHALTASCVIGLDEDDTHIRFLDAAGHRRTYASPAAAMRFVAHRSTPCRTARQTQCFDAAHHTIRTGTLRSTIDLTWLAR